MGVGICNTHPNNNKVHVLVVSGEIGMTGNPILAHIHVGCTSHVRLIESY